MRQKVEAVTEGFATREISDMSGKLCALMKILASQES